MKSPITKISIGKRQYQFANIPKTYLRLILSSLKQIEKSVKTESKSIKEKPGKVKSNKKTGKLVKRYRERAGISQGLLAKKLKMTQGNISQIETGRIGVNDELAKRLGKILKVGYRKFM